MSTNSNPSPFKQASDLRQVSELAQKFSKGHELSATEREATLEKLLETARKVDIPNLVDTAERELKAVRQAIAVDLDKKREEVLQQAEKMGQKVRRFSDHDRIGPVRVTHKGTTTNILFGKLRLESLDEPNGTRTAERVVARVKAILEGEFDAAAFYKGFRKAYDHARLEGPTHDGWVRLEGIYREYALGRMRNAFGKRAQQEPKALEPYSMACFLVDFAKLLRAPEYPGGEYIRTRFPSMAQSGEAYLVPDVTSPLGEEKLVLDMKIEREP